MRGNRQRRELTRSLPATSVRFPLFPGWRFFAHERPFEVGHDQAQEGRARRQARQALHQAHQGDHRRGAHGRRRPDGNPRLRKAIADAKGQAMPNDTIKRAVKRGTGEIEGAAYEEVLYEGTGPGGTLFLVEGMTDNRNRTVAEIRKIFEKHNGVLGGARHGAAGPSTARASSSSRRTRPPKTSSWKSPSAPAPTTTRDEGEEWHVIDAARGARHRARRRSKRRRSR